MVHASLPVNLIPLVCKSSNYMAKVPYFKALVMWVLICPDTGSYDYGEFTLKITCNPLF